jgi:GNAT superfamily N-acetyltransferase
MPWELTGDVETFAAVAAAFLRSRPVEHTTLLTLVEALRQGGPHVYGPADPLFGVWRPEPAHPASQLPRSPVAGVLLQTPPHPMMFSGLPPGAAPAAVAALAGRPLCGVNLRADEVDEFVAIWRRRTGTSATVTRRTRLHRLATLVPPPLPDGRARCATTADRDLLVRWYADFYAEIGEEGQSDLGPAVDDRLGYGGVMLWETGGRPVALAIRSRAHADMIRIQTVYTPREHRARGYAGAVTAVVTRQALDLGVEHVVLFTDLANATSNALYQRLGYRPVEDRVVVEFRDG